MPFTDTPTILWIARGKDGRFVECTARLTPRGIEIDILSSGTLLATYRFNTSDEALAWAEDLKRDYRPA